MGATSNPLAQAVLSRLAQLQGGAPPSGGGAPPASPTGGNDDSIGAQFAQQSSELHGADPGMVMTQLQKVKSVLGALFIHTFQRMPNVSGHISKTLATLDRAIKEAQTASQTASAVRTPLGFSLADQTPPGDRPPSDQVGRMTQ